MDTLHATCKGVAPSESVSFKLAPFSNRNLSGAVVLHAAA